MASSRDALRADSDLRAYSPCHRRDGTADPPGAHPPPPSSPGRVTLSEDNGPGEAAGGWTSPPRDSNESVAGRPEQLADVGRSDPELRRLNDYASTGSGPTCQSDARDSEPLLVSVDVAPTLARAGYCFDYPLLLFT